MLSKSVSHNPFQCNLVRALFGIARRNSVSYEFNQPLSTNPVFNTSADQREKYGEQEAVEEQERETRGKGDTLLSGSLTCELFSMIDVYSDTKQLGAGDTGLRETRLSIVTTRLLIDTARLK